MWDRLFKFLDGIADELDLTTQYRFDKKPKNFGGLSIGKQLLVVMIALAIFACVLVVTAIITILGVGLLTMVPTLAIILLSFVAASVASLFIIRKRFPREYH